MALTGIQIFKLLPKTNCGECGVPTCLAFAMNLAAGKAELDACPYVSDEAREQLAEASAPPIRPVKFGSGDTAVTTGGETVLFRHEKTFFNPCPLAATVKDTDDVAAKVAEWEKFQWDRVGLNLRPELVFVKCESGDAGKFEAAAKAVADTSFSLILGCEDVDCMAQAAKAVAEKKPLLYAANNANADKMAALANEIGAPLCIKGADIEDVQALATELTEAGYKDLVLDTGSRDIAGAFQDNVAIRRAALMDQNRILGFPTICFASEMAESDAEEVVIASMLIAKYAGIVGAGRHYRRKGLPASSGEAQHLHRPAAAHGGGGRHLRDQRPRRRQPLGHHHQLLPHLLHRVRRDRGLQGSLLAAHQGHRGGFRS